MKKIAVDAMGGDYAPQAIVEVSIKPYLTFQISRFNFTEMKLKSSPI